VCRRRGRSYQQPLLQVWMVIPSRDKLGKQLGNSGGSFTIAGYDYSPLQIFSKRFVANLPLAERRRFLLTDLNNGPVACQGNGPLRMKWWFPCTKMPTIPLQASRRRGAGCLTGVSRMPRDMAGMQRFSVGDRRG
jgi:hypothetical protein